MFNFIEVGMHGNYIFELRKMNNDELYVYWRDNVSNSTYNNFLRKYDLQPIETRYGIKSAKITSEKLAKILNQ